MFGRFFNLRSDETGNRVIIARNGPLPSRDVLEERASALQDDLEPYGIEFDRLLPMMTTEVDWDPDARVLTDQYSPVNLLRNQ